MLRFSSLLHVIHVLQLIKREYVMTSVRLPEEMESKLNRLCALTHRAKSFYIIEALAMHLDDLEDTYIALERISNPKRKFLTTEQVLKDLE